MAEDMKRAGKLPLDEFLAEQAKVPLVGTVEEIAGDDKLIKVTPWFPNGGCMCHAAIKLPRQAIASVTPTGDTHLCCGKVFKVVQIEFARDSSIPITDVLEQLVENASKHHSHSEGQILHGVRQTTDNDMSMYQMDVSTHQMDATRPMLTCSGGTPFRCQCGAYMRCCMTSKYRCGLNGVVECLA